MARVLTYMVTPVTLVAVGRLVDVNVGRRVDVGRSVDVGGGLMLFIRLGPSAAASTAKTMMPMKRYRQPPFELTALSLVACD